MSGSDLAGRVRAILAGPHVTEKKMFGGICFLYDGHMTVAASVRGLLVRVGKAEHEAALARPATRPMDQKGRKLPGYIYVDDEGTRREADLKYWVDKAIAEVTTLPPKAAAPAGRRRARASPTGR